MFSSLYRLQFSDAIIGRWQALLRQIISNRKDFTKNIGNNSVVQQYSVCKLNQINILNTTWSLCHNPILPGEQTSDYNHWGLALEILFKESKSQDNSLYFHNSRCHRTAGYSWVTEHSKQAKEQKSHTVSEQSNQYLTPNTSIATRTYLLNRPWR